MKKIMILVIAIFVLSSNTNAQNCNCDSSFSWLTKFFEENDAGFQMIVDKKGRDEYDKHTEKFRQQALSINKDEDCQAMMIQWTRFFRKGHVAINLLQEKKDQQGKQQKELTAEEVLEAHKNDPRINLSKEQFIKKISSRKQIDTLEGIFSNDVYTIGILRDDNDVNLYNAFIIESLNKYWVAGQIKIILKKDKLSEKLDCRFFMRDHSEQKTEALFNKQYPFLINISGFYWMRKYPEIELPSDVSLYFKMLSVKRPFIEKLSEKTVYLRIPSFNISQTKIIDSTLKVNESLITSIANLIVDIRNGTGGGDQSYSQLITYLQSGIVRLVGVELKATPENLKIVESLLNNPNISEEWIGYLKKRAAAMRANMGRFVQVNENIVGIDTPKIIYPFPKQVVVLMNQNNGSTDEQFLLEARQSKKVKLMGVPTFGELDASNLGTVKSPCGKYELWFATSRSFRLPELPIDDIGVQPDILMDKTLPEFIWIKYAKEYLEN